MRPPAAKEAAAQAATARPSFDKALDQLTAGLELLQREFERYFSGALPIPPEDLRAKFQAELRQLRNTTMKSAVDQFRMSNLEHRANMLSELWNRRLREREEGRGAAPRAARPPASEARLDARSGVVLGADLAANGVETLYQGLYASGAPANVDLESFKQFLGKQVEAIRIKTGCDTVQFRVTTEDGKLKLKGKPVGGLSS